MARVQLTKHTNFSVQPRLQRIQTAQVQFQSCIENF
jgi:hypothetical protein